MSILLFGSKSFIGRNIIKYFKNEYNIEVVGVCRNQVDCLNAQQVLDITRQYKPELVINCVVKGGRRAVPDSLNVLYENIITHQNIVQSATKVGARVITFGSGAEVARNKQTFKLEEKVYLEPELIPKDYYGLSKYTTHLMEQNVDNLVNIRVFGCFGPDDDEQRFIMKMIASMIDSDYTEIEEDKWMDYIYINDLCNLVFNIFKKKGLFPKTVNAVYQEKYKLSSLAEELKLRIKSYGPHPIVVHQTLPTTYIGKSNKNIIENCQWSDAPTGLLDTYYGIRSKRAKEKHDSKTTNS